MAKALISPGFGAGWSTWIDGPYHRDLLFDPQLIADVEEAGDDGRAKKEAAERFQKRMVEKYGEEASGIYMGGAGDLEVVEVDGPFTVEEYDGFESIRTSADLWIIPPE